MSEKLTARTQPSHARHARAMQELASTFRRRRMTKGKIMWRQMVRSHQQPNLCFYYYKKREHASTAPALRVQRLGSIFLPYSFFFCSKTYCLFQACEWRRQRGKVREKRYTPGHGTGCPFGYGLINPWESYTICCFGVRYMLPRVRCA
jgi:hypothetical protein